MYQSYEYIFEKSKAITPSFRFDDNNEFSEWSKKARKKLSELLGLPFEVCDDDFRITETKKRNELEQIDFEFQSEENYYVKGAFLKPACIKTPLPTVICLQGHSSGMHISLGEAKFSRDENSIQGGRDFAVQAVKEGCCAVVIEQRYMGSAGQDENGSPICFTSFRALPSLLMGRCAIGERVWDIQRLIDVIKKYFFQYADMEHIICMGNSGGGTTTFYASAMDDRISLSVPSCSVCTYGDSIMAMSHCACNYVPGIRKYFDMGDIGMLIAPRKMIIVCGKNDPIFPLKGVQESYEIIKKAYQKTESEENLRIVIGEGGHQFYPDDVWPILHKMLD